MVKLVNPIGRKQVGGHWTPGDITTTHQMRFEDHKVKKPMGAFPEDGFYKKFSGHPLVTKYDLMATFYGTERITAGGTEEEYIVLSDLTDGYRKPCVLDIKMGTEVWFTGCDAEKKARCRDIETRTTTSKYGFRLTGMRTKDPVTGADHDYPRDFSWYVTTDADMAAAFDEFLSCAKPERKKDIINFYSEKINHAAEFVTAIEHEIRSSSLLLLYEADPDSTKGPGLFMIDFAHTQRLESGRYEEGYAFGCNELTRILSMLK